MPARDPHWPFLLSAQRIALIGHSRVLHLRKRMTRRQSCQRKLRRRLRNRSLLPSQTTDFRSPADTNGRLDPTARITRSTLRVAACTDIWRQRRKQNHAGGHCRSEDRMRTIRRDSASLVENTRKRGCFAPHDRYSISSPLRAGRNARTAASGDDRKVYASGTAQGHGHPACGPAHRLFGRQERRTGATARRTAGQSLLDQTVETFQWLATSRTPDTGEVFASKRRR